MALPRTQRLSFETREERILEAAGRLFARLGYRGTTTRAIAEAAEVNEALLFRHFASKEELYDAFLNRTLEEWNREVLPTLEEFRKLPIHQALTEIARVIVGRMREDPRLVRTMVFASLEDARFGKLFFSKRLPLREFFKSFFKERQERGEIRKEDPAMLATTYLSLVFYYIHIHEVLGVDDFYPRGELATLDFFAGVFLKGVSP
jgi:TetR/AcrR family transcriptional regulator